MSDGTNVWRIEHTPDDAPLVHIADSEYSVMHLGTDVGTIRIDGVELVPGPLLALGVVPDDSALDFTPDDCWRCDAARGETDVGLCPTCHADLTAS